jgi:hypothetical protein
MYRKKLYKYEKKLKKLKKFLFIGGGFDAEKRSKKKG